MATKAAEAAKAEKITLNPIEAMERRTDENLRLWRINETTDPAHTRSVKIGRDMTAIDSYYQIKRATETFGPLGIGWGWNLEEDVIECAAADGKTIAFAKCKVTLWYIDEHSSERVTCGPVIGVNQLVSAKGYGDDEAFKKATTDGVTKALSYLGFSADIFMGLYDDNKYVARLKDEFGRKAEAQKNRLPLICTKAVEKLPEVKDLPELDIVWKSLKADLLKLPPAQLDYMKTRFAMRKRQLAPEEAAPDHDPAGMSGGDDQMPGPGDHLQGDPHNAP